MGQRYEKNRKNVGENKEKRENLRSDRDTLKREYAPMSLLEGLEHLLDDEASDSIRRVRAVGEQESSRLESETDAAEAEKRSIADEIRGEIAKLDRGAEKLRRTGKIEFGKSAVEQARAEYKKQIEKFNSLLGELGEQPHSGTAADLSSGETGSPAIEAKRELGTDAAEDGGEASILGFVVNSIISPHDADVKKWTSYLDSFSDTIRRQYTDKYGQYITPGKLDIPLSDTLVYETQALFESKGIERGVLGYNDGTKSHVAVGTKYEMQTTIHENLHQLSANGNANGIIESNGTLRNNVQMNEAITEMLTQRTLGEQYGPDYSAYSENRDAMRLIEKVMGEDTISRAYFQNRPDLMRDKLESALGQGTWEQLSEAFDDCMSNQWHTSNAGRVRRDQIINRYLMTASEFTEGEESWINLLS